MILTANIDNLYKETDQPSITAFHTATLISRNDIVINGDNQIWISGKYYGYIVQDNDAFSMSLPSFAFWTIKE